MFRLPHLFNWWHISVFILYFPISCCCCHNNYPICDFNVIEFFAKYIILLKRKEIEFNLFASLPFSVLVKAWSRGTIENGPCLFAPFFFFFPINVNSFVGLFSFHIFPTSLFMYFIPTFMMLFLQIFIFSKFIHQCGFYMQGVKKLEETFQLQGNCVDDLLNIAKVVSLLEHL